MSTYANRAEAQAEADRRNAEPGRSPFDGDWSPRRWDDGAWGVVFGHDAPVGYRPPRPTKRKRAPHRVGCGCLACTQNRTLQRRRVNRFLGRWHR